MIKSVFLLATYVAKRKSLREFLEKLEFMIYLAPLEMSK